MDRIDLSARCLWVLHADKIPPHIGISNNGLFFSLKVRGKDENVRVESLVNTIYRKRIPTLCYELTDVDLDLSSVFDNYRVAIAGEITCLAPIKEVLNCHQVDKVSELIEQLELEGRVKAVGSVFLPEGFTQIPSYELNDIHERLKAIQNGQ